MSDDSVSYSLQNLLTNIATRVGSLEGSMKTFMENWARQDALAHESRRIQYERIEMLTRQVERVATDINGILQDIAEMKKEIDEEVTPHISKQKAIRDRATGAKGVWAMLGALAAAIASALAYIADKIMAYVVPKP